MDFTGTWVNAKNSILKLVQQGDRVTGTFDSGVSDGNQVYEAPIVGWANGDRIAFSTTYPMFGTVVAWVGQAEDEPGNPKINAHFLHESEIAQPDEGEWLWYSTRTGSDSFVKR